MSLNRRHFLISSSLAAAGAADLQSWEAVRAEFDARGPVENGARRREFGSAERSLTEKPCDQIFADHTGGAAAGGLPAGGVFL